MKNIYNNETALLVDGTCGIYKYLDIPLHCHEQIELVYVNCGSLNMTINGQDFTLTTNDFIAIRSLDLHSFNQKNRGNIFICPIMPSNLSGELIKLNIYSKIHHDNDGAIFTVLSSHSTYKNMPDGYTKIYFAAVAEMLKIVNQQTYLGNSGQGLALSVMQYIGDNYQRDIHLKDIAKCCNSNATYVSNTIKKETSLTLPTYLNRLRLRAFIERCKTDEMIIIDYLLHEVGFNSPRTFYRAFQREFHMTPQEFIAKLKGI